MSYWLNNSKVYGSDYSTYTFNSYACKYHIPNADFIKLACHAHIYVSECKRKKWLCCFFDHLYPGNLKVRLILHLVYSSALM